MFPPFQGGNNLFLPSTLIPGRYTELYRCTISSASSSSSSSTHSHPSSPARSGHHHRHHHRYHHHHHPTPTPTPPTPPVACPVVYLPRQAPVRRQSCRLGDNRQRTTVRGERSTPLNSKNDDHHHHSSGRGGGVLGLRRQSTPWAVLGVLALAFLSLAYVRCSLNTAAAITGKDAGNYQQRRQQQLQPHPRSLQQERQGTQQFSDIIRTGGEGENDRRNIGRWVFYVLYPGVCAARGRSEEGSGGRRGRGGYYFCFSTTHHLVIQVCFVAAGRSWRGAAVCTLFYGSTRGERPNVQPT